ncbi:MAG TPA: SpoIIE family protein phosphatase [Flavobacteriales bacterium]|nr:SpoIIE family protein phosphatase [Flavobacteriales bacterium]
MNCLRPFKKLKAPFIGLLLFILPVVHSYGSGVQDSIQKIFAGKISDSLKIIRLSDLALGCKVHSEVSEVIFSMMAFSEELSSRRDLALCFRKISVIYIDKLRYYDNAIQYAFKAVRAFKQVNDKLGLAASYNVLANSYQAKGEITHDTIFFNRCIEYHEKNIALRKEMNDTVWLNISYINVSSTHLSLGQYDKAIEYLMMANKFFIRLRQDEHAIGMINVNLGYAYLGKARLTGNAQYYTNALKYYNYIFTDYFKGKVNTSDPTYIAAVQQVGEIYCETGKPDAGLEYLHRAHRYYEQINDKPNISSTALLLAKIYAGKNDQKSNEYLWIHLAYKDSLLNEQSRINVEQMQAIYQSSEKEKEIQALRKDKEKQAALTEAGNKRKNIIIISTVIGLILVLVFLFFILNRFKVTQRQKRIIEIQKETVDASQKKIIDSINYAKKIQYSILPSKEEMNTHFPNHFVFFRPKDIVSGDFYWFHHEENLSFFAVVDCTGHGVPGAFMTMIAHSILIEVVVEQKITSPEKILGNLHGLVFKNLQQQKGDEYSQDGMDISLAVIDQKNKLLHFAGARNNAFLVENGEVRILKASQKSIGGLSLLGEIEPVREFKSETVPLKEGSLLIMSTDGFFDQLDPTDEKFGTARFKEMIMAIKSTDQGFVLTEQTYLNWKGHAAQLDDVLLTGIKL